MRWLGFSDIHTSVSQAISRAYRLNVDMSGNAVMKSRLAAPVGEEVQGQQCGRPATIGRTGRAGGIGSLWSGASGVGQGGGKK